MQAARAKAAAAGIPSSEPMTLDELETVQAKMDAKRRATPSGKFNAGEHFLSQPNVAAQSSSADNLRMGEGASDATHASDAPDAETSSAQSARASTSDTVTDAADGHARTSSEDSSVSPSYEERVADVTQINDQDMDESQTAELRVS